MNCTPFIRHCGKIMNNERGVFMPKGIPNRNHTGEFKQKVVEAIIKDNLSYREAERIYNVVHSVIMKWERIYFEEGPEVLYIERRGRATNENAPGKARKKSLDKKTEEDLVAEVQRLRMENEYLKKLNALVQKKEKSK